MYARCQKVTQAVADTAERAADLAETRPAPTERYSKQSPTLGLVSYRHPVEYDHACEGDVLTIVRTASEHIA